MVISHSDQAYAPVGEIENFFAPRPVFTAQHLAGSWHAIAADYAAPAGKVIAFCGIANPENFRKTLLEAGVDVHDLKAFPDHHSYDQKDLAHLAERSLTQSFPLVTTEKDAARLSAVQLPPSAGWWSLGLKLSVDQEDDLLNAILARIES